MLPDPNRYNIYSTPFFLNPGQRLRKDVERNIQGSVGIPVNQDSLYCHKPLIGYNFAATKWFFQTGNKEMERIHVLLCLQRLYQWKNDMKCRSLIFFALRIDITVMIQHYFAA